VIHWVKKTFGGTFGQFKKITPLSYTENKQKLIRASVIAPLHVCNVIHFMCFVNFLSHGLYICVTVCRFPQLEDSHFANSRDKSFEWDILRATGGKGVNVVLNSLAEEKLQASVRLLAPHGQFLEIGKFDLSNDSRLGESGCVLSPH